jgi:septum formation protein
MLVLASASPRRQELLRQAGIPFTVQPADLDETPLAGESPRQCAERLARAKALAVARDRPGDLILGADTVVAIDDIILGKPVDDGDAARMLRLLSGRMHHVITGVCLVTPVWSGQSHTRAARDPNVTVASETTLVKMLDLSNDEIREYIATGEPVDKAGAYAIQGHAGRWIPSIEGDYENVVGLPVKLVLRMLQEQQDFFVEPQEKDSGRKF